MTKSGTQLPELPAAELLVLPDQIQPDKVNMDNMMVNAEGLKGFLHIMTQE